MKLITLGFVFIMLAVVAAAQPTTPTIAFSPESPVAGQVAQIVIDDQDELLHWTKSGGTWCLTRECVWLSDAPQHSFPEAFWMAEDAGTYTLTATPPNDGTPVSISVVVRERPGG